MSARHYPTSRQVNTAALPVPVSPPPWIGRIGFPFRSIILAVGLVLGCLSPPPLQPRLARTTGGYLHAQSKLLLVRAPPSK